MISIEKVGAKEAQLLSGIAIPSFIESHGHSADPETINNYVTERYNPDALHEELNDEKNIFHILYYDGRPAGYSKIIFDHPYEGSTEKNITKLERIYVLKEFYDKKLGLALLQFNIELARNNQQSGIWLFVWIKNQRAFNFYKRNGFTIIGSYDFRLSPTHTNPNHQMLLSF